MIIGPYKQTSSFAPYVTCEPQTIEPLFSVGELAARARARAAANGLRVQPEALLGEYLMVAMRRTNLVEATAYQVARQRLYCLASPADVLDAVDRMLDFIRNEHGVGLLWHLEEPVHYVRRTDADELLGGTAYTTLEPVLLLRSFYGFMPIDVARETGRLPEYASRAQKVKQAMAGIERGEHLADPRLRELQRYRGSPPVDVATVFAEYALQQKEVKRSRELHQLEKDAASAEWSRRLRELAAAAVRRDRHQVLVDVQDLD